MKDSENFDTQDLKMKGTHTFKSPEHRAEFLAAEELRKKEEDWRDLRGRRKLLRFTQEFLIDLLKLYGDLPKGTTIRGCHEDFDTADIVYQCLHPDWAQICEGECSPRVDVELIFPSISDKEFQHLTDLYNDLIMTVGLKHEGETRHETARRYIKEAEKNTGEACANTDGETK